MEKIEERIEKLRPEFDNWYYVLNNVIGVIAFQLGFVCLSTQHPSQYALISFGFIICLGISLGDRYFPKSYSDQRKKKRKTKLEELWFWLLDTQFFSTLVVIRKCPAYLFGVLFLVYVWVIN